LNELHALARNYRTAFLRYLPRREEAALAVAYELGRDAVTRGVSLLDLARIHHEVLADMLGDVGGDDVPDVALAASEFFLEAIATYDMTQRRYHQPTPP
jgi:phosphoserine phosphatase RsbU-like protein